MEEKKINIEKEIQERVSFKLNDIRTSINNTIKRLTIGSYNDVYALDSKGLSEYIGRRVPSQRVTEESWETLNAMFKKEIEMPVPFDDMHERKLNLNRDESLSKIMNRFDELTRGVINNNQRNSFLKMMISEIEKIQRDE